MENINTMAKTPVSPIQGNASAFATFNRAISNRISGTSERGCTFGAFGLQRWIDTTGLTTATSPIRTGSDAAGKGHVALVAYVPGIHAWSPPIC